MVNMDPLEDPCGEPSDAALQRLKQMNAKSQLAQVCYDAVIGTMAAALSHAEHRDCSSPEVWQQVRSKILDAGNDHYRDLQSKLEMFDVEFIPKQQIVFEINDRSRMELTSGEGTEE